MSIQLFAICIAVPALGKLSATANAFTQLPNHVACIDCAFLLSRFFESRDKYMRKLLSGKPASEDSFSLPAKPVSIGGNFGAEESSVRD